MTKPAMVVNPYRNVVEISKPKPKADPIDWSIVTFWAFVVVFAAVEGGSAVFGFRAFVMWVVSRLEGLIH